MSDPIASKRSRGGKKTPYPDGMTLPSPKTIGISFIIGILLVQCASAAPYTSPRRRVYQNVSNAPHSAMSAPAPASAQTGWIPFSLQKVSMSYPAGWKRQDFKIGESVGFFPDTSISTLDAGTAIYLRTDGTVLPDLSADAMDANFLRESTLNSVSDPIDTDYYRLNFALQSKSGATLLGHPARLYRYTMEVGGTPVQAESIVTSIGRTWYETTFVATSKNLDSDHAVFATFLTTLSLQAGSSSSVSHVLLRHPVGKSAPASSSSLSSVRQPRR